MAKKPPKTVERTVVAKNCVTIFGGGVAGLTAAHELVERGFRVQLWEPRSDPRRPARGAELGGMARTQWTSVPWADTSNVSAVAEVDEDEWASRQTRPILHLPQKFFLDDHDVLFAALGCNGDRDSKTVANELWGLLERSERVEYLYCEVFSRKVRENRKTLDVKKRLKRAKAIIEQVKALVPNHSVAFSEVQQEADYPELLWVELGFGRAKPVHITIVDIDDYPDGYPLDVSAVISFRVRERWIPGEHGFRFFPSFYYHVFDTMKRTPILEPATKSSLGASQERAVTVNANPDRYTESGRTVFDNLRPTTKLAIGFADGRWPSEFSRTVPKSFEELLKWIKLSYEGGTDSRGEPLPGRGLGFTARDTARFQLKLLQFLTTSASRRREYEHMSWFDFLGGAENFSLAFEKAISAWPEALVAMSATEADARTHGAVLAQLVLDNLREPGYRDGTLNGPTSEAWIKHWKRYLEAQGVEFIHGRLDGFQSIQSPDDKTIVWPKVTCYEPRYAGALTDPPLLPGYFVLALPARAAKEAAQSYRDAIGADECEKRNPDMFRLASQVDFGEPEDLKLPKPKGQLRHMVGLQYYFDEDISWLDGHAYFPGSPWGLSSISQVRFWQERHDWEHGYRGILSVVLSVFNHGTEKDPKRTPWESSPAEIALEVWRQIERAAGQDRPLPMPRYWHIDDDFNWNGRDGEPRYANASPYQINLKGTWNSRPGTLHPTPAHSTKPAEAEYSVADGIVCAGTHMKTFTRLTTMEAANESARHAVNAILKHAEVNTRKSLCVIWPIEDREVVDFEAFKELDAELYARGLDHFMEILGLDDIVTHGFRGGLSDPFDPIALLTRLRRLLGRRSDGLQIRSEDNV